MMRRILALCVSLFLCMTCLFTACAPHNDTNATTTTSTIETTTSQTDDTEETTAATEDSATETQKQTTSKTKTTLTKKPTTTKTTVITVERTTTKKTDATTTAETDAKTTTEKTTVTTESTKASSATKTTTTTVTTTTTTTRPTVPTIPAPSDMAKMEETLDFIVDVESGRDPVVLQLTDPQFTDDPAREARCYQYFRETIEATKPDLILITGDLVYGRFDPNGDIFKEFVAFMESFKIPWAPVFGNHDCEVPLGIKWLCTQLEEAEYCCFKKGTVSGNGNYTVGIRQGNAIPRVFFMMGSRGYSNGSLPVGFATSQINWYKEVGNTIKTLSPKTKLSFAFHIQLSVFGDAFARYGYVQDTNLSIDAHPNKKDGDFGFIGRGLKDGWDTNKKVWGSFKELGVDSVFVGHEHSNSASIVYEGIRLQYGQKSSTYDRYNTTNGDSITAATFTTPAGHIPIMGGTVMTLADGDGTITDAHIYYCKNAGGQYDWSTLQ